MSSLEPNAWCRTLGIAVPRLEDVAPHREANTYSLLIVALLEHGAPMTLDEVAARFARAGISEHAQARLALQRCKPARPPVYREGERYALDPHDDELDLWAFRFGLRPPKIAPAPPPPPPEPLPGPEVPLTLGELDEAWRDASLTNWSTQRFVLAVLDANRGPAAPKDVVSRVNARAYLPRLREEQPSFGRRGSAIAVLPDGRWDIAPDATEALHAARAAVRERVAAARRHAANVISPERRAEIDGTFIALRSAHAAELAKLTRAILVGYPARCPEIAALLDVGAHTVDTFAAAEFDALRTRISRYDVLAAVDVRALLGALGAPAGERRLAELGPSQKTIRINRSGRTRRITTTMLVQGSCGIARPFGDERAMAEHLARGDLSKLRHRLEADAKSLHALYEYGRLHGCVRLRWGFLDERLPAPWKHPDEPGLYELKKAALATQSSLDVVVGSASAWSDPWANARRVFVEEGESRWRTCLVDENGVVCDDADVQRARLTRENDGASDGRHGP